MVEAAEQLSSSAVVFNTPRNGFGDEYKKAKASQQEFSALAKLSNAIECILQ